MLTYFKLLLSAKSPRQGRSYTRIVCVRMPTTLLFVLVCWALKTQIGVHFRRNVNRSGYRTLCPRSIGYVIGAKGSFIFRPTFSFP